ncbi:MAG: hypothetical protein ABJA82_19420, partial [Myxococcales bacterium]
GAPEPFNVPIDSGLLTNPDALSGGRSGSGGRQGTGGGFEPPATGGNGTGGISATGGGGASTGGSGFGSGGTGTGGAATGGRGTGGGSSGGAMGTGGRGSGGAASGGAASGGAAATGGAGGRGSGGRGTASGGRGTGGAASGGAGGGGTGSGPCSGLCTGAITVPAAQTIGNLGTAATCHQIIGMIQAVICGNFVAPRTLTVNSAANPCTGGGIPVPAPRNGGYCMQATPGQAAWAYFTTY